MTPRDQPPAVRPPILRRDAAVQARLDAALAAKGDGYEPRTRHRLSNGRPQYVNRLILETSPYLLQHAHNPVDWYPWGDEAFERARQEHKPVLLSIGYSTCHWCHVMERESFEDSEIAAFINEHYIAIKVDREERPDVDNVYMTAVQLLTGRGGWPLTVVLTPDRQPFFGGTYFPPRDGERGSRRGFLTLLRELAQQYADDPDKVVSRAELLSRQIAKAATSESGAAVPDVSAIVRAVTRMASNFDPEWGGFRGAPKFPRVSDFHLLLRYARRSGDSNALEMVASTLRHMAKGGICDQIGGGFHRYSTDRYWRVPHFEKMLYDNAQLATVYVHAWQATGEELFAEVARETLDYLTREMSAPSGGFYSATDADSAVPGGDDQQEEGWFFTWTPEELESLLGASDAAVVAAYYGVTASGNLDGRNVLYVARPVAELAREQGKSVAQVQAILDRARERMLTQRAKRPPPLRDEKVIASWNGLTISAFAIGGFALDRPDYIARATRAATFVVEHLRDERGRLRRTYAEGTARHDAVLDDYAFVIAGLLDLYEASSDPKWLGVAIELQAQLDRLHLDASSGGYFLAAHDVERLLTRVKPDYDGAEPSGNSIAALNNLRLAELTERAEYRRTAEQLVASQAEALTKRGASVPQLASALDFFHDRPLQVFIVSRGENDRAPLLATLRSSYVPNRIITVSNESEIDQRRKLVPGLAEKRALGGRATAYVCEQQVCQQPTSDPAEFRQQLQRVTAYEALASGQPSERPATRD